MRAVVAAAAGGDERAGLALDVFVHRLAKAVAGMVVGLGLLDALVFTGGIGEHSAEARGRVLARLGFLGLAEDPAANAGHGRATGGRISPDGPAAALVGADRRGTDDRPPRRRPAHRGCGRTGPRR